MKKTLFLIAILLVVISGAKAQTLGYCHTPKTVTFLFMADSLPEQYSYQLIDLQSNQVLTTQNIIYSDTCQAMNISLSTGNYRVVVTDTQCDGISTVGLIIVEDWNQYVVTLSGCQTQFDFYVLSHECEYLVDCNNSCPTDLDFDGTTGVSDLLLFINEYGHPCE